MFPERVSRASPLPLFITRLFSFSVRIHFGQITSNQMLVPVIEKLKETTIAKVSQVRVSRSVETQQRGGNAACAVPGVGWHRPDPRPWSRSRALGYRTEVRRVFTLPRAPPQDVIGFNMAGLEYLKRECEAKSEVMFFADATSHLEEKKRKRKKREKLILTLT